jgi:mono/diheme cytochrome c family protein
MGLIVFPMSSYAQATNTAKNVPIDIGKQEYHDSCAMCHGDTGKGDGPVAAILKPKVPDLTILQKNNQGVFPFARLYDVIDGRREVAAHGPRDMPIWGQSFRMEAAEVSAGYALPEELSSFARGRIIALIGYISTLQEK